MIIIDRRFHNMNDPIKIRDTIDDIFRPCKYAPMLTHTLSEHHSNIYNFITTPTVFIEGFGTHFLRITISTYEYHKIFADVRYPDPLHEKEGDDVLSAIYDHILGHGQASGIECNIEYAVEAYNTLVKEGVNIIHKILPEAIVKGIEANPVFHLSLEELVSSPLIVKLNESMQMGTFWISSLIQSYAKYLIG